MMDKAKNQPPVVKKIRGSYFPRLPRTHNYNVEDVSGNVVYAGRSEPVARLVASCLTPRVSY